MDKLLQDAAARAARYVRERDGRAVTPAPEALEALAEFYSPLPEEPLAAEAVIETLDRVGSPATMVTTGGRFFGFVHGGVLPAALAANWLAGAWDQNAGLFVSSAGATAMEDAALAWLLDALRLPADCAGAFVTGATMANFTALAAARGAVLERAGWDVEADGLIGAPPVAVVVGEEAHPSVTKALGLLGFGRKKPLRVPADAQGRMRPDKFPRIDGPAIVCIQAGNVNSGAFDPAEELCALAHERGAWVHVDGAFGLWASASPQYARLAAGFAAADSWATDAHKYLNVPYDSGLAFVRDARALQRAMSMTAAYLIQGERREPCQFTPELSRRGRGVEIWAALRSLGRSGLADLVERTCRYARRFADGLRTAGCEVLNDVVFNQALVSFGDDETTLRTIAEIQREGVCWCGQTRWRGRAAMRVSVCSWATTEEDVERSLASMLGAWKRVRGQSVASANL